MKSKGDFFRKICYKKFTHEKEGFDNFSRIYIASALFAEF